MTEKERKYRLAFRDYVMQLRMEEHMIKKGIDPLTSLMIRHRQNKANAYERWTKALAEC